MSQRRGHDLAQPEPSSAPHTADHTRRPPRPDRTVTPEPAGADRNERRNARRRLPGMNVRSVALCCLAMVVLAGGSPGDARAQEISESSLSALFPVDDTATIWQVSPDSGWTARERKILFLTRAGAVVGDVAAGAMVLYGVGEAMFGNNDDAAVVALLAIPVAVGGPVLGTAIARGNVGSSFKGSLLGLAGGGLLGAAIGSTNEALGGITFLFVHAVIASRFAVKDICVAC